MKFNSIGRQGNYSQAGKAVADDALNSFIVARRKSPEYGKIAQDAANIAREKKINSIKAQSDVTNTGIAAAAGVKANKIKTEAESNYKSAKRKAGVLAAGGQMIGEAGQYLGNKRTRREVGESDADYTGRITRAQGQIAELDKQIGDLGIDSEGNFTGGSNSGGLVEQKPPGKSVQNTGDGLPKNNGGVTPIGNGTYTGSLDQLSDEDKKWIAYTVTSEAARGTDDEFGVAGVVINRMRSGNYPTSAYDVGHQKGQFEGVEIGNSVHDPELVNRLFSGAGLQKLEGALQTLDGRDSFKGQALLGNRSSKGNKDGKLDPMFHSSGNYFHHSWQT